MVGETVASPLDNASGSDSDAEVFDAVPGTGATSFERAKQCLFNESYAGLAFVWVHSRIAVGDKAWGSPDQIARGVSCVALRIRAF